MHVDSDTIPRWLAIGACRAYTAVGVTLAATIATALLPGPTLLPAAQAILAAYFIGGCLLLPRRLGLLAGITAIAATIGLETISAIKTNLTGLPLTMLDLRIALAQPRGLWEALKLPRWSLHLATVLLGLVALCALALFVAALRNARREPDPLKAGPRASAVVLRRAAGLLAVALLAGFGLLRVSHAVVRSTDAWEPAGLAAISERIGVLPYLVYSQLVATTNTGDFFASGAVTAPPDASEIRAAVLRQVDFDAAADEVATGPPNIVVVLAESTFDPDTAFQLAGSVNSPLFAPQAATTLVGPLWVNVVGGGTWVTEFESFVGLDSRLFGYAGYYTHASLAPYVRRTLITDLRAKGYATLALLPHDGGFYNYRNAFEAYGFTRIVDSRDRGHGDRWQGSDREIAAELVQTLGQVPSAPFYAFVGLVENHGPHVCDVASVGQMPVRFAGTDAFEPNCALHEYVRRLRSTEAAVASIGGYLRELETRTRRPYVLLVYGDHQPFSFTGTHMVRYDFGPYRTSLESRVTFLHLEASDRRRLKCCLSDVTAALLPSLLSAYVENRPDDVYLGVNFWLHQQCGHDWVPRGPLVELTKQHRQRLASLRDGPRPVRSAACESAYPRALAAYRREGVIDRGLVGR